MTTVLAEGEAMALCALCATHFAAECFCGERNNATLRGAGSANSEASGCGGERRGRRFRLRTGLRNFLRLSEAALRQFCLLSTHAFLIWIWFWCCPTFELTGPLWQAGIWTRIFSPNSGLPQWVRLSEWLA